MLPLSDVVTTPAVTLTTTTGYVSQIFIGEQQVIKIYLGGTEITNAYLGSVRIF